MNVLVLRNNFTPIVDIIKKYGDSVAEYSERIDLIFLKSNAIDFIVSHGYRHIIEPNIVKYMRNRIINLHISFLPWNRGADPNLWSFLEDTRKGVTIHYVDEGIDTGDIIAQREIIFSCNNETLRTTYHKLQKEIVRLFEETWPQIRKLEYIGQKQIGIGSYHKTGDKREYEYLLVNGWDTKVKYIRGKGIKK